LIETRGGACVNETEWSNSAFDIAIESLTLGREDKGLSRVRLAASSVMGFDRRFDLNLRGELCAVVLDVVDGLFGSALRRLRYLTRVRLLTVGRDYRSCQKQQEGDCLNCCSAHFILPGWLRMLNVTTNRIVLEIAVRSFQN
jgi:hypothetical protein